VEPKGNASAAQETHAKGKAVFGLRCAMAEMFYMSIIDIIYN